MSTDERGVEKGIWSFIKNESYLVIGFITVLALFGVMIWSIVVSYDCLPVLSKIVMMFLSVALLLVDIGIFYVIRTAYTINYTDNPGI